MNLYLQIEAFFKRREDVDISHAAADLYLALLKKGNDNHWTEAFDVPNRTFENMCQMSKAELHKHRNVLIQYGFIGYAKGKRGTSGRYTIVPLYKTNGETGLVYKTNNDIGSLYKTNPHTNSHTNPDTIDLYDIYNKNMADPPAHTRETGAVVAAYEDIIGPISPAGLENLTCHGLPDEVVCLALELARDNAEGSKAKYAEKVLLGWVNAGVKTLGDAERERERFKAAFKKPTAKPPEKRGNRFANNEQRAYDVEAIERQAFEKRFKDAGEGR